MTGYLSQACSCNSYPWALPKHPSTAKKTNADVVLHFDSNHKPSGVKALVDRVDTHRNSDEKANLYWLFCSYPFNFIKQTLRQQQLSVPQNTSSETFYPNQLSPPNIQVDIRYFRQSGTDSQALTPQHCSQADGIPLESTGCSLSHNRSCVRLGIVLGIGNGSTMRTWEFMQACNTAPYVWSSDEKG